jgi:hypothetical protein
MLHHFSSIAVVLATIAAAGFAAIFDLSKDVFESKVRLI